MTSPGLAAASAAGEGHWAIHSRQRGSTRATGVCWSITSLTSTAHGSVPGSRHGRSRAAPAYQSTIASPTGARPGSGAGRRAGWRAVLIGSQSALCPAAGRGAADVTDRVHCGPSAVAWRATPGRTDG
jgi:hypothetical protein